MDREEALKKLRELPAFPSSILAAAEGFPESEASEAKLEQLTWAKIEMLHLLEGLDRLGVDDHLLALTLATDPDVLRVWKENEWPLEILDNLVKK